MMINFFKLSWPKGLNLDLIMKTLPEKLSLSPEQLEKLKVFLVEFSGKRRKKRIVIFPSDKLIKKLISHYLLSQVSEGTLTWEEARQKLEGLDIAESDARRFFHQRNKEILKEKGNKK